MGSNQNRGPDWAEGFPEEVTFVLKSWLLYLHFPQLFALCLDSTSVKGVIENSNNSCSIKNEFGYFSPSLLPLVLDYRDQENTRHPGINYFVTSCLQSVSNSFGKC